MSDHYTTLGVAKTASPDEIKRAYRKLASQHHPDKGGDVKRFQEIEEAYRILSDPQKRTEYDNPPQQHFHFGGMPNDLNDIFKHAFGFGSPFGDFFNQRQNQMRNRDLNMGITITLEDAFHGKEIIANMRLPNGREQVVEVRIPPGIKDNTTLRLQGMGDDSIPNVPRGNIHLTVSISGHHEFRRENDDLIKDIEISCIDAMLGKTVEIETIDKKLLEIRIGPGTQPNQVLSIHGYGMPNMQDPRMKGRLLLNVKITVPQFLTQEQEEGLKKLFH